MLGSVTGGNFEKGRVSEEFAAAHLKHDGYRVVARNQRTPLGELDIICFFEGCFVVVEVKARSNSRYGEPLEAIGPRFMGYSLSGCKATKESRRCSAQSSQGVMILAA